MAKASGGCVQLLLGVVGPENAIRAGIANVARRLAFRE